MDTNSKSRLEAPPVSCDHCGLPVPRGLEREAGPNFCCTGCRAVYELLLNADLGQYYARRSQAPGRAVAPQDPAHVRFSRLDQAEFEARSVSRLSDGTCTVELGLDGLHCAACVWLIERLPRIEPAVIEARVDLGRRTLFLRWLPTRGKLSALASRLESLGYAPSPLVAGHAQESLRRDRRDLMIRMGVAFASAGNAMLMAFALYSADFGSGPGSMAPAFRRMFEIGSLVVSLPALWASLIFFRSALSALYLRSIHMDLPIALGITAAYAYSLWGVLVSGQDLYFDSITTLIFLLLVGRYLRNKHESAHADALELARTVTPAHARRLSDVEAGSGSGVLVPTDELRPGDLIEVLSGEAIPMDGRVTLGQSELDLSLLTGESTPVFVGPSDPVFAGGTNQTRRIVVTVERSSQDSRAALLMQSVEQALRTRAPLLQVMDRYAGPFTITLVGLAACVAIAASHLLGVEEGVRRAIAILVIACPCALSMATPLTLNAAIGRAARERMLIKGTATIETLGTPSLVVFDKTGTLTEGELRVVEFSGAPEIARLIADAECASNHPVARALTRDLAAVASSTAIPITAIVEQPGAGLLVETERGLYVIGSERFLSAQGISVPESDLASAPSGGGALSPVLVGHRGAVVSIAWLDDPIRENARSNLLALQALGHRLAILSGDHPGAVSRVRAALDPDGDLFTFALGAQSPEDKLARIGACVDLGPTIMIGDGVNDAAALARAHVGVAVSGAAEASMLSADVYLANAGIGRVTELFEGARRALGVVRRGLRISIAYNLVSVTLAALGFIGPLWAAVLMPLSSISVVTNAYRSRSFGTAASMSSGFAARRSARSRNQDEADAWSSQGLSRSSLS